MSKCLTCEKPTEGDNAFCSDECIIEAAGKCKVCGDPTFDETCSKECFMKIATCRDCPENQSCAYAWDDYNTNGDCLVEK